MSQTSLTPTATQPPKLAMLFLQRVEASADKEAFRYPENGGWTSVTWKQTAERVDALAAGLLALGVAAEDRIGIASTTRFEWILADHLPVRFQLQMHKFIWSPQAKGV